MNNVKIPILAWYGDKLETLTFPDNWEVVRCSMAGYDKSPPTSEEIKSAFEKPIGTSTIRELARNRKEAVIIFDDMTRGTQVARLIPYVLNELKEGGITDGHIRFIMALGVHGARHRIDFVKKLGKDVVEKYPVYNHNAFENFKNLGKTSRGTPIHVNKEVAKCDLKIGIGSIVPHYMVGFGGGSKIILPGVVSMKATYYNHCVLGGFGPGRTPHPSTGLGTNEDNILFLDMEEAAQMAGLDVKIDALMNEKRETVGLFVGSPTAEHKEASGVAKKHYLTKPAKKADIVVANAYTKANESCLAVWTSTASLKEGGTMVLISNTPEGQVTHYLYGKFGKKLGGRGWEPVAPNSRIGKFIVYSPYKEVDPLLPIENTMEKILWVETWAEVLRELKVSHKGDVKVAVYPCAEIQYPPNVCRMVNSS